VTISVIDNAASFASLRLEWNELLAASSSESPFLTWEWLHAWWTHLAASRHLAVVTVRDDEQLVAIAPFCKSRGRFPFLWRYELMGTGFAGSDYLDAFIRRGYELRALQALAEHVRDNEIALHLVRLPRNSWLSRLAPPLIEHGWSVRTTSDGFCPFIRLAGHSWDSFLATIGSAHRATTRRRLRCLEKNFALRFDVISDDDTRRQALAKLFEFHHARFGTRGTAFHTGALRAFHHDVTERLQQSGVLRLLGLYLNDDLAAVMYGMSFQRRFYFYQHGYDPAFQSHGVGRAVLDLSIRAAISEGLAEFDLLWGGEGYKSAWTSDKRTLARLDVFPSHLGGRVHQRAVETERSLRALARRVISGHVPQTS
jgi:CelD/BcsL family acetyltransferase involved in cellulose biosynthesis